MNKSICVGIFVTLLTGCATTVPDSVISIMENQNRILTELESLQKEQDEVTRKNIDELYKQYEVFVEQYYACERLAAEAAWEDQGTIRLVKDKFDGSSSEEESELATFLERSKAEHIDMTIEAKKTKALEAGKRFEKALLEGAVDNRKMVYNVYESIRRTNEDAKALVGQSRANINQITGTMDRALDLYENKIKEK